VQIFNGEKPANTPPIRVDIVPGTKQRYSGGGVTIEQQVMLDVTEKPFATLMKQLVLDRVSMKDSTYEQPLSSAWAARTATEHILTANLSTAGGTFTPRWLPRDYGRNLPIWQSSQSRLRYRSMAGQTKR